MIAVVEELGPTAALHPLRAFVEEEAGLVSTNRWHFRRATEVSVCVEPDGRVIVNADLPDVGTSIYTIAAEITADALGVSIEQVVVRLAHSKGAGAGASWGASNVCIAVDRACRSLRRIVRTASGDGAEGDIVAAVRRHFPEGLEAAEKTLVQMDDPLPPLPDRLATVTVAAAILESGAVIPLECSGYCPSSSLRGRIDTKQGRRRDDSPEPIPLARGRSIG